MTDVCLYKYNECPICFHSIENTDNKTLNCCQHTVHKKCLNDWYKINNSCPFCRTERSFEPQRIIKAPYKILCTCLCTIMSIVLICTLTYKIK